MIGRIASDRLARRRERDVRPGMGSSGSIEISGFASPGFRLEIHNLATSRDPEHRAALERLRDTLARWIEETGDMGRVPESPEVAAARGATRLGSSPNAG